MFKLMITLHAKIPKDLDFHEVSNNGQLLQRHDVYLYILSEPMLSIHKLCVIISSKTQLVVYYQCCVLIG